MPQLRAPYSPAFDFVAMRPIDVGDEQIGPGEPFPKDAVPVRRHLLLYEALWIEPLVPGYRDPRAGKGPYDVVPADYYAVPVAPPPDDQRAEAAPDGEPPPLAPAGDEPPAEGLSDEAVAAKHLGQGKWSVVRGDEVIHPGPLTKEEAKALAADGAVVSQERL